MTGTKETYAEVLIRHQIEKFVNAFRTKDLNLMMSLYTPEFVSFDIVPPLRVVGRDAYCTVWETTFTLFKDPIEIELRDVVITTAENVAFSHNLLRLHATRTNGYEVDYWERLTFCFRQVNGEWLIAHEHVSVPADLANGTVVLDLTP